MQTDLPWGTELKMNVKIRQSLICCCLSRVPESHAFFYDEVK